MARSAKKKALTDLAAYRGRIRAITYAKAFAPGVAQVQFDEASAISAAALGDREPVGATANGWVSDWNGPLLDAAIMAFTHNKSVLVLARGAPHFENILAVTVEA